MSKCVVRMEMPETCFECPMFDDTEPRCIVQYYKDEVDTVDLSIAGKRRMNWCPIICQLPEGHGRLVDAEEMYKKSEVFCNQCRQGEHDCEKCNYIVAQGYMYKSPTIVPADAERSE